MGKTACLEPITYNKDLCFISVYNEDQDTSLSWVAKSHRNNKIDKFKNDENCDLICFDIFKVFNNLPDDNTFFWDVKILYQLAGYKVSTLPSLVDKVFDYKKSLKYRHLSDRIHAHLKSYEEVGMQNFQGKVFPDGLLERFYKERMGLTRDLFVKFNDEQIKAFYRHDFHKHVKTLHQISKNRLTVDVNFLSQYSHHYAAKRIQQNVDENGNLKLFFNPVGAITGRLSFKKKTVNIYNLPLEMRKCIQAPKGYQIVQFDFKSFQPYLAIYASKNREFIEKFKNSEDIYSVFPGSRELNKVHFLAWMYSDGKNKVFDELAKPIKKLQHKLRKEFEEKGYLKNPFGRILFFGESEKGSTILQRYITSLEVDFVLNVLSWLQKWLTTNNKKSKIIFPFHDSVVMYMHKKEIDDVKTIKNKMENFCKDDYYPTTVKIGNNFKELRRVA